MASDTDTVFLDPRPLVTSDGAALLAGVAAREAWQPSFVVRTNPSTLLPLSATNIAAAGDVYRIMLAPPSAMPDYLFYPISLNASWVGLNVAFWDLEALYSIVAPVGPQPLQHAWRSFELDSLRKVYNGAVTVDFQSAAPKFQGFPPSPVAAIQTGISAIGGFQFVVQTFQAAEKAALNLSIDARWLAFPRAVERSAGFYMPRMFFTPT